MAGSYGLFDSVQLTASSEYDSRYGSAVRYLQIHHATMTSLSGLISLMHPGGRDVSANGAMGNDGHLVEVVPVANRAFTSASSFDRQCITVECCNTTLSPNWNISAATRTRLARLAVSMFKLGLLGSLSRTHIIGHYEVPGTYATACPGPDMHLDAIVAEAKAIYSGSSTAGGGYTPLPDVPAIKEGTMKLAWTTDGTGWLVTEQGWTGLPSMQVFALFSRVIDSPKPDTFLRAEVTMMIAQQRLIAVGVQNNTTIDPVKLAAAISDALPGKLSVTATLPPELILKLQQIQDGVAGISLTPADFNVTASVDPALLAAAFDVAIPRITKAILKQSGDALSQAGA